MDRYEIESAAYKIDGYYFPPRNCDDPEKARLSRIMKFEEAKTECLLHLTKALENVRALSFEEFLKGRR